MFYKKTVLKISQYSQENVCVGVVFNKVAGLRPATLLKKKPQPRSYNPVNIEKFSRTPILKNICKRLFPCIDTSKHFFYNRVVGLLYLNDF